MVTRSVGGIDKRFFFKSAFLNPNPDPCIMDPDPQFFKEGVTMVSHSPPLGGVLSQFLEY